MKDLRVLISEDVSFEEHRECCPIRQDNEAYTLSSALGGAPRGAPIRRSAALAELCSALPVALALDGARRSQRSH